MTYYDEADFLTIREVAKQLRVDDTTVRRWIKNGVLEAIILPHRGARQAYRIRKSTLDSLLAPPQQPVEAYVEVHKQYSEDEEVTRRSQEYHDLLLRSRNEGVELETVLDRIKNLTDSDAIPVRVEVYREALKLFTRNMSEPQWAYLQITLANYLAQNPLGEQSENLEQAIFHYEQALQVFTLQNYPEHWAQLQFNLGLAYSDRIRGEQSENLEQAIASFHAALSVFTLDAYPQQWARTLNSLAIAYSNRVRGERAENLEQSIQIWQQILSNTPPWSPEQHHFLNSLGERMVARYHITENNTDLERAIHLFRQAIEHTSSASSYQPNYLNNWVGALRERYHRTGNNGDIQQAIELAKQRLDFFELQGNLMGSASSYYQLGMLAQDQGNYAEADPLYKRALEIEDQMLGPEHSQHIQTATGSYIAQADWGSNASVQIGTPDEETQQRYMNVCIVRQEDRMIVPKTTSLVTRRTYDLRLDIGPLLDESVVQNAEQYPFPAHLLPPTNIGYWLEVIVVSDDVAVPLRQHHLFLPRSGPSWVCDCSPGDAHLCSENERQPYLFISIQTPEQPQVARLRIAIYYQKNLVQSQLFTANIAEMEQSGAGQSAIIDYTLTSDLRDLSFLPPRTLNIVTNDNADGSHRIVINGEGDDVLAFHVTEGQIRVTVDAAREALRNVHFEEYGGTLGSKRQRRNLLDNTNAKTREAFIHDLERVAPLGWKLWTLLLKDRLEWRKKLLAPATIQVSRTLSSTLAFPWALVYDIPLDSQGRYTVCPLIEHWDENKKLIDTSGSSCPHEGTHGLKNTLCPFGFWGFRHSIEQPPSMLGGRNLPLLIHRTNQPLRLVAGLSQDLTESQTEKHLQAMKDQLTVFTVQDRTSLQALVTALADPVEVVYFYCHGGREALVGTSQHTPYLQVGKDERFEPSDITTWRVADWPEHHWEQTSPLVFINGCHTAELTPELLVNFVDAFSTAYASGVIGTEISVEQHVAAEAAECFFTAFQQSKTVGQALQQMRLHFLSKGNLLGLAYTPYCSANLHL